MSNAAIYIGTKIIEATPMTRLAYNERRGWQLPADERGEDEGYLVVYIGQESNLPGYNGYVSWSPKDVFEQSYQRIDDAILQHIKPA